MLREVTIYMSVEKKYPLPHDTLTRMLRWKLYVNYEDTKMSYELLRLVSRAMVIENKVKTLTITTFLLLAMKVLFMSSSNHPIIVPSDSDIEDALYSINVPDYFPASPGNTSPDFSNDLTKYLLVTLVFSPLHDDPYMEIMQACDANPPPQAIIALPTIPSPKDTKTPIESPIPISPSLLVGSSSPVRMPPKRTSTSEAPAMTQAAIKKLVTDNVAMALEA
ncbi:hypothetical protein Tco_1014236 [Tanacetum coccineum]